MPFFITRVVATLAAAQRHSYRVMTADKGPFATRAEADSAARERFAGQECHIVEANTPGDALQKILPELDSGRAGRARS
jgi:hypothetical protein